MLDGVRRLLRLRADDLASERVPGAGPVDVHFPKAVARAVLAEYSAPGDTVLDPFAGYGTTLAVCEELGRTAVGVELLPERVAAIRRRLRTPARVIEGDARRLDEFGIGPVDLCLTSPPYMNAVDHPQNPLTGYTTLDGDYPTYLAELTGVFLAVGRLLRPGGHLVVNAANIRTAGGVTPLAWDIAHVLGRHMAFLGEIYLLWDRPQALFSGDYCLVFRTPPGGDRRASGG